MRARLITVAGVPGMIAGFLLLSGSASVTTTRQAPGAGGTADAIYQGVTTAARFDVSAPLSELALLTRTAPVRETREVEERGTGLERPRGPQSVDQIVQPTLGALTMPAPLVAFDLLDNVDALEVPDPVGDVGPNHYVAMTNSRLAVFDKTGTLLAGPAPISSLWAGFGGPCEAENAGDPIVLHDQLADRWFVSQFTASPPEFFNCVAISTGPDPIGTYFRYAFSAGSHFPDYPKYGVWPDAYYLSVREFAGVEPAAAFLGIGARALNRTQMIAGNPTPQVISFLVPASHDPTLTGDGLLPADLDGTTLPPSGSPEYFLGAMDDGGPFGPLQDALTLWKFFANFASPSRSTFTMTNRIAINPYDTMFPCGPTFRDCISQPNLGDVHLLTKLDILSYRQRPTWRLAYRNFRTHESLVANQSVEAAPGVAGIRWWEIRDGQPPTIFQEGTFAPGVSDHAHRWMGSIAMDRDGSIALGYSVSGKAAAVFPSIRYTGRLAGDPLGTLPQGEGSIVEGAGAQTGGPRWGDYTSMNVDPVDDCTFWYVNEYIPVTSPKGWRTRVGAFKFPTCGLPGHADLAVSSLTNPPAVLVLKQGFVETDRTRNQGVGSARATTTRFYLSSDGVKSADDALLAGSRPVPIIAPAAESFGQTKVTVPAVMRLGVYHVLACADDLRREPETDESNNCRASVPTVEVRAPDLLAAAVSNPPVVIARGQSFSATDTVKNQGNADAPASSSKYYLSADRVEGGDRAVDGSRAIGTLPPATQSTGTVTVSIPGATPPGDYFLLACADDGKRITESNEQNNCIASALPVRVVDVGIGTFSLTPGDVTTGVHDRVAYALTWIVPEPRSWHVLDTVDLRIVDAAGVILWIRFAEATNSFAVFDETAGKFGNPAAPRTARNLETAEATLHMRDTTVAGSGPAGQAVTLHLAVSFKPRTAGRSFTIEVAATDDLGAAEEFKKAGALNVRLKEKP